MEMDHPFGVVLIRHGREVGQNAEPYDVGTLAHIARVTRIEDGKMNIVAIGGERFRLVSTQRDLPYLTGEANPWPLDNPDSDRADKWLEPVRALFLQYITLLAEAEGHKIDIQEEPEGARTLALMIAIALQLPMSQKQRLLVQPTVAKMLETEARILRREQLIFDYIIQTQADQWEGGSSGFLAKN